MNAHFVPAWPVLNPLDFVRPGLQRQLPFPLCAPGRASFYVRLLTPLAKLVQRGRGNGRVRPGSDPAAAR